MDSHGDRGPGEPELPNRAQEGCYADDADGSFGGDAAGIGVLLVRMHEPTGERFRHDGEHGADTDADECEARETLGPPTESGVD